MPERGVIDYDQIRQAARTGDGAKLATSAGTLTPGNLQRADAHGNIEDAGVSVDTDVSLAANSDAKIASQKATKAYVDAHAGGSAAWGGITGTLSAQTDLQSALDAKVDDAQLDTDVTLAANSDSKVATQKATKAYVDAHAGGGFAWGGDGSDGSVTFDGTTTVLGLVPSASAYTLTRDLNCVNITVNAGVTIKTSNYAISATGTATINGTVHNDGQVGSNGASPVSSTGGNGGTAGLRTSHPGGNDGHYARLIGGANGGVGGNGGTGAGSQAAAANAGAAVTGSTPADQNGVAGSTGSSGGKGGSGTSGAGGAVRAGAAGGAIFTAGNWQSARNPLAAVTGVTFNVNLTTATPHPVWASNASHGGSAGGSGGGGDTTNSGGGGGGGGGEGGSGGVVAILANTIAIGATGIVRANGGNGGNGGNGRTPTVGNCGGGGGGGGGAGGVGGIVWLVFHSLSNAGTVQALGGSGGNAGLKGSPSGTGTDNADPGVGGSTGPAGNVMMIPC